MVPRVLSDLFWLGRYAERAEDLLRLILATRTVAIETDLDTHLRAGAGGAAAGRHRMSAPPIPGFLTGGPATMMPEFRVAAAGPAPGRHGGAVARALSLAAQGVRDQLSDDVWMVLADIERALAALAANPYDQGLQLTDASERVLSGLLALAGISQREHGPRRRLVHARHRSRAGARAAGAVAAAGHRLRGSGRGTPSGW